MRLFLLPLAALLAMACTQSACSVAELRMPETFPAVSDRYPVSGRSPRWHGQSIRFGPYSALEMREGDRFGWAIPLGAPQLEGLSQRWSYTQIALHQAPVQSQCRARTRTLRHDGFEADLNRLGDPLLACGFRADGETILGLQLARRGDRLEGQIDSRDGDYLIRSLHGLQGTPIPSGSPTGYEILRNGRAVMVVDRVNAGSVAFDAHLAAERRVELAAVATALLLFDPGFGED